MLQLQRAVHVQRNNDFASADMCLCQQAEVGLFFVFRYSIKGEVSLFFVFRFSLFVFHFSFFDIRFSFFDIRIRAEYRTLTFEILF